jgi:hypothetical protein
LSINNIKTARTEKKNLDVDMLGVRKLLVLDVVTILIQLLKDPE